MRATSRTAVSSQRGSVWYQVNTARMARHAWGRITKAGDAYLRTLLVLGAKSVLAAARNRRDRLSRWAMALEVRCGYWKAVVAIAAKNARMAWAVLAKGDDFKLIEA